MKKIIRRIWLETGFLMAVTFAIDIMLFAYHTPFWAVCLTTLAIFVGGDMYYQHQAPGGYDDE